jgi:hypothetical protein
MMSTPEAREKRRAEVAEVLCDANEVLAPTLPIPGRVDDAPVLERVEISQSIVGDQPDANTTAPLDIARETVLFSCNTDPVLALLISTRVKDEEQRKEEVC